MLFTITIADSTIHSGGKISIKLTSGTLWNKVNSLKNTDDIYEIESPTTVMEARGTLFLATVDPASGETTGAVMEGTVGVQYNTMQNMGAQEQLVPMGSSIQMPPLMNQPFEPPPPPTPIDMNVIIDHEDPSVLAIIAADIVDRMQELQQQTESYLTGYQNTNNIAYLKGALYLSQISTELAYVSQQFMSAVQGTAQEQQMNQILQQQPQQRNLEMLNQQVEQLSNQVQDTRNNLIDEARRSGVDPEEIERLTQNAPSAPIPPPPPVTPPSTGDGSSNNYDSNSGGGGNGNNGNEKVIYSVNELESIVVDFGTSKESIQFPEEVEVTLNNDTTQILPIIWNLESTNYNPDVSGDYEFIGVIELEEGITNTNNLVAQITVTVAPEKTITAVTSPDTIVLYIGTDLEAIKSQLPSQVEVTLNDQTTKMLNVIWDDGTDEYLPPDQTEAYLFIGTIPPVVGIINPDDLKAQLIVKLVQPT